MLMQRPFAIDDLSEARRLIRENGWAVLATAAEAGLGATHLPCLLDPDAGASDGLVILGHTARADPQSRELAAGREVLLIFQGPHGYISPSWYPPVPAVPTWNYTAVHVHGVPEILSGEVGFQVLMRTVEHFEASRDEPWTPDEESLAYARRIAPGTVAFRLRATRVDAKAKLSQNKAPEVRQGVIEGLDGPGAHHQPALAAEMRRIG